MRFLVRLVSLLLVVGAAAYLVCGAYWMYPDAFKTKLKLILSALRGDLPRGERGKICGFESPHELLSWRTSACRLDLSSEHRGAGRSAGRISFTGGTSFACAKLEDYVFGPGENRDWSSFERLSFWLKNGGEEVLNLEIQVKDCSERRFHHFVRLEPGADERVSIELESLSDAVDVGRIASFIVCAHGTSWESDLFIDEIVLEGEGDPLGTPFITFSDLKVPRRARRGETFSLGGHLRAEKPVPNDYRVFVHIYPESQASVAETSKKKGLINADHNPPVRTSLWDVGSDESIGELEVYIPEENPPGRYVIEMGLFNPRAPGRPERKIGYKGAYDFSGSYPKCRYTNGDIRGYVVGRFEVL